MKIPLLVRVEEAARRGKAAVAELLMRTAHPARLDADFVICRLEDHWMAFDPKDRLIGKSISQYGGWERPAFRSLMLSLCSMGHDMAGRTFVDVGANIGTQTIYAFLDGGFSSALCVEPVPANLVCFRANVAVNGFADRVHLIEGAAGAGPGEVEIGLSDTNSGGHSILSVGAGRRLSAPVDAVDAYLARGGVSPDDIGMLWIDVEGFEPQVIEGAAGVLAAGPPLVLEFNGGTYGKEAAERFFERLAAHYESVGIIRDGGVRFAPKADVMSEALSVRALDLVWLNAPSQGTGDIGLRVGKNLRHATVA